MQVQGLQGYFCKDFLWEMHLGPGARRKANLEVSCGTNEKTASHVCKSKNNSRLCESRKVKK